MAEAVYEGSLVDCRTGAVHGRKQLDDHEQRRLDTDADGHALVGAQNG
jgi:hypothetical protein